MSTGIRLVLALVFVIGLVIGIGTPQAEACHCFVGCDCMGRPVECCVTPAGTVCAPIQTTLFRCLQQANC